MLAAQAAEARWTVAEAVVDSTSVTVEIWSSRDVPEELAARAIEEYGRLRGLTSAVDPASELSRVNANAAAEAVDVGAELFVFLDLALRLAEKTNGVVDPTSTALRFSSNRPSADDARSPLDYRSVVFDREQSRIHFAVPDVRLGGGALGAAYALAGTCEWLRTQGVQHAQVRARGNACYVGDRRGEPWSYGVTLPEALRGRIVRLALADAAVASVGDFTIYDDRKVVFTVTPTPESAARSLRSATVFGRNAMIAAGLAQMIYERGPVLGFENLLEYPEYEAFVFDWSGEVAHTFGMEMTYSER